MDTIFFTHIQKTAGTSLRESVIEPNMSDAQIRKARGAKDLLSDRSTFDFLQGHYPYGIHQFAPCRGEARYFVMLRDPVKRALSFYTHARTAHSDRYVHPANADARANDIVDFYRIPEYQNSQARFVSGFWLHRIGQHMSFNRVKSVIYRVACRNLLRNYEAFGLTERFDESARLFAGKLGWTYQPLQKQRRKTGASVQDDLTPAQVEKLRCLNAIDVAVYDFAYAHFHTQLDAE